jgi:hypothetical protein
MKLSGITEETAMYPTIGYDQASARLTGAGLQARHDALAGAVRYRAGQPRTQLTENYARCEALFASGLQRSDVADADCVAEAIRATMRRFGIGGCVSRMAQEFGDHPEAAAERMRWARSVLGLPRS